jgi:DNA repair protein SbcC/Rad50
MLKSIELKNFRSHKHSLLEFCKGINVIIGKSLSGKTNIIRGLLVQRDNRPLGFKYHSRFAGDEPTEIKTTFFDDGTPDIKFSKTERTAVYEVGDEKFKGIRANVPDRVVEALNLSEINIQEQLEKQFLICSSPGETAKAINRITHMEEIDTWTSKFTTRINSANGTINQLTQQQETLEGQLKTYTGIDEIGMVLEKAEKLEAQVLNLDMDINALQASLQLISCAENGIATNKEILRKARLANKCLELVKEMEEWDWEDLSTLTEALILVEGRISMANSDLTTGHAQLKKILEEDLKGKCPICLSDLRGKEDAFLNLFK